VSGTRGLGFAMACACVLAIAWAAADAGDAAPATALTNEDIVRMVATETPEREILEAIGSRPEAFDVSDDMVAELSLAGVSPAIVAAMRRKHNEAAPQVLPSERQGRGKVRLSVTLNAGAAGARTLRLPAWADEDVKALLQLPKENDQREVKDVAVFLACATAEHVPDLWRSKSPLGRDMVGATRSEMLAFVAGDTPAGKKPQLTVPDRIEADVDGSEPHDLLVGVAARIGDRWFQLAVGRAPKFTVSADAKPLACRITHAGGFAFKVECAAEKPASR